MLPACDRLCVCVSALCLSRYQLECDARGFQFQLEGEWDKYSHLLIRLPEAEAAEIASSKSHFHRMLRGILEDGKQSGLFHFEDSSIAASALGGMASWTFFWFHPEGRWEPESVARQVAALSLKTVGVSDPDAYVSCSEPDAEPRPLKLRS